jgi:polysaccharide pyruvyl transferase WcaK-like protein/glycosyltransferase involved in cell wall biosynthesis
MPGSAVVSRMSPCPCGSGKRFKHCCGIDNASEAAVANDGVRAIMQRALLLQQEGNLQAAESLYRKALETARDQPDCLHMLGVICYQTGKYVEAATLIWQALQITGWSIDSMKHNLSLVVARMFDDSATWDGETWGDRVAMFAGPIGTAGPTESREFTPADAARDAAERLSEFAPGVRVLYVDGCAPQPDRDSASVRLVSILCLLRRIGCAVAFHALDMSYSETRDGWMEDEGIEVLRPPAVWGGLTQILTTRGRDFDLIFISRFNLAQPYITLLRHFAPDARFIVDTVDLHFLRERRMAELTGDPESIRHAALTQAQELGVIRAADCTLVVSEYEKQLLAYEAPGAQAQILSNIHDVRGRRTGFDDRRDLFFVGGFAHAPNVDAVCWYAAEVWPRVRRELPDVVTYLVGSNVPDSVRELAGDGIVVVGHAPDLTPYLDGCRASVAPLRFGAGVKGKIGTAQGSGVPVIATTRAAESMYLESGRNAMIADTAQDFADAIVRVYGDRELWTAISDEGMENIRLRFSPDAARKVLAELRDFAIARNDARADMAPAALFEASAIRAAGKRRAALILVPAGYGSLGDEAMVRGLLAWRDGAAAEWAVDLISIYGGERWPHLPGVRDVIAVNPEDAVSGLDVLAKVEGVLPRYDAFAIFGADVLDGHYSLDESRHRVALVEIAERLGLATAIFGFSINEAPCDEAIADLVRLAGRIPLCVRDPVSVRRLADRGLPAVVCVADVAFLMPPAESSFATRETETWIEAQKSSDRRVAIINLSRHVLSDASPAERVELDEFADAVARLVSNHRLSILWCAHDLRTVAGTDDGDVAIVMNLSRLLSRKGIDDAYHRHAVPASPAEAKRLAGLVDLVITGRMHLAIAALGMGTPAIGISYQGKFEGLWQLFGMMDYVVDSRVLDSRELERLCVHALLHLEELTLKVAARLPQVVELARRNFASWPWRKAG